MLIGVFDPLTWADCIGFSWIWVLEGWRALEILLDIGYLIWIWVNEGKAPVIPLDIKLWLPIADGACNLVGPELDPSIDCDSLRQISFCLPLW